MIKSLLCKMGIHQWRKYTKNKLKCKRCGKVVPKWYLTNRGV